MESGKQTSVRQHETQNSNMSRAAALVVHPPFSLDVNHTQTVRESTKKPWC